MYLILGMKLIYKIVRTIIVSMLICAIGVPALLYLILSLPSVQDKLCNIGEAELSKLIGVPVKIGSANISPFNKLALNDVVVMSSPSDTTLYIKRLGAGLVVSRLLSQQRLVFSHAEIIGLDARLWRDSANSPLNIQPIIQALQPKEKNKPPTHFDLRINNIVIRQSALSYDVNNAPSNPDKTDFNHIKISEFNADIQLPRIANDDFTIDLKRLALIEKSGLTLESISGSFHISSEGCDITDLTIRLPESAIALAPINISYQSWDDLTTRINEIPLSISTINHSHVALQDLTALIPSLRNFNDIINLDIDINGCINDINLNVFDIYNADRSTAIKCRGRISNVYSLANLSFNFPELDLRTNGNDILHLALEAPTTITQQAHDIISRLGNIKLDGHAQGSASKATFDGLISSSLGNIDIDANIKGIQSKPTQISGSLSTQSFDLKTLFANDKLGSVASTINLNMLNNGRSSNGTANGKIDYIDYNNYRYKDISMSIEFDNNNYNGNLLINNNDIDIEVVADLIINDNLPQGNLHAKINTLALNTLNLIDKFPDHSLSGTVDLTLAGNDIDHIDGRLSVADVYFTDSIGNGISIEQFAIQSSGTTTPQYISINSDILDGHIEGYYRFNELLPVGHEIASHILPSFFPNSQDINRTDDIEPIEFSYSFEIKENEQLLEFFQSPIYIVTPIDIRGRISELDKRIDLIVEAPYLQQKNKIIENTALNVSIDGLRNDGQVYATTLIPTKKGAATIVANISASSDRLDSDISWDIAREHEFNGNINLSALLGRNKSDQATAHIDINHSEMVFNDTTWNVLPAKINIDGKNISVNGLEVSRDNQFVKIDGNISEDPEDILLLQLLSVNLDYVFETLDISSNVMFGGTATGNFYASDLLSKEPRLNTPKLHVDGLKYNGGLFGDTDIVSAWNNETRGIDIDAVINQPNGRKSYIDGTIYPLNESLDFKFNADRVDVTFMKPYMSAFTSEVSGYASGDAHLYGTFKDIDMTGEIFAEDLRMKIDYTNTYYTCTDSVHITPGRIDFNDVTLHDAFGNTALLSGWVSHKCFRSPKFNFQVKQAQDILCYDETKERNSIWYGRIFGTGGANITGEPGMITIDVNMSTAPKSVFTFELSDEEEAYEYNFITFRDRDREKNSITTDSDPTPLKVRQLRERLAKKQEESSSSRYVINLQVDADPDAQLVLVMDPVGGDRIKAHGNGNLRMVYDSAGDLEMFGTYTLTDGSYNFTLQDIIVKDFIIKQGSSISFTGDPFAAILGINAVYPVNANLSDLDESFLQDKELNRTNVPVHAVLKVDGNMLQPDISFDLEFPTLTQDTYRKVKSIVSTDDMMNRQIIYLLALNRFYTPDYMGSTTKGSELVSVASSTISSQLSSMLGQLSDNWSIAPNFRSDKGDFSDMEVDLALSSHLLNNRLLFNGNFGYRDKTMNDNSFIGDFDIEYLLNRSGNIRLKAYNRYNDRNYYVKTALTTQGVGIMFKRDFDSLFSFLRPKRKNKPAEDSTTSDSNTPTNTPK